MITRIIFGVVLIILSFISPWWVVLLLSLAGLFYFENLYEVVLVGLIMDSLYGTSAIFSFPYTITLVSLIFVVSMGTFRKRLIMY